MTHFLRFLANFVSLYMSGMAALLSPGCACVREVPILPAVIFDREPTQTCANTSDASQRFGNPFTFQI